MVLVLVAIFLFVVFLVITMGLVGLIVANPVPALFVLAALVGGYYVRRWRCRDARSSSR